MKTSISYFNTLYGEFNSQGIFIDMENNTEEWNVFSTSVHESTHSFLEYDSYLGQLGFLIQQVMLSLDKNNSTRKRFKEFNDTIYDATINVQESIAVFWELSFLETYNPELMDKEWETYKRKRPQYYHTFRFIDLEDFLDDAFDRYKNRPTAEQIKQKADNILLLAKYCMNIDISKLSFLGPSPLSSIVNDKASFNPNYRLDKAIRYIKKNKIAITDLSVPLIEDIFNKLGFSYLREFDITYMSDWANNNILKVYNLNDYSYYIIHQEIENPLEQILYINAYISDCKYSGRIVTNPSTTDINNATFYAYTCDNEISPTPTALVNVNKGEILFIKKSFNSNLAIKIGKVFTDRHSYPILCREFNLKLQIKIYIDIANWDLIARKFLNSQCFLGYIRYELNDNFSVIFLKGIDNLVFFITLPTMNIPVFEAFYLKDIELLNDWWQSTDDLLELCSFIMKTVKSKAVID